MVSCLIFAHILAQDRFKMNCTAPPRKEGAVQLIMEIMGGSKMRYQDNASDNMMGVTKQEESIVHRSTGRSIDGMKCNEVRGTVQDTGRKDQGKKQIRARLSLDYEGDEFAEEVQISDKWIRMN